jgi:hypothetical protein
MIAKHTKDMPERSSTPVFGAKNGITGCLSSAMSHLVEKTPSISLTSSFATLGARKHSFGDKGLMYIPESRAKECGMLEAVYTGDVAAFFLFEGKLHKNPANSLERMIRFCSFPKGRSG